MYEWLNMWAEQYGSHEALCDNKGSYSYESLNTSVKNLSIGFADMGLRKSDKVILQLDNCNEFVIVCFALMSMGVIPILAVPGLRVNDLDIIAKKANSAGIFISVDHFMDNVTKKNFTLPELIFYELLRIFYEYPPFSFFCSIIRTVKNTFLEVVLC